MTNSKNQELLEIREYAIKSLREELLGPGSERGSVQSSGSEEDSTNIRNALTSSVEEEKISERPEQRYILGVLHPQEDADLSEDDCVSSASRFDDSISSSGGFKPSSMGLCFVVTRLQKNRKFQRLPSSEIRYRGEKILLPLSSKIFYLHFQPELLSAAFGTVKNKPPEVLSSSRRMGEFSVLS